MTSHWYTSPDPPRFGEDLIALCGKLVSKAQPVPAVWDGDELGGLVKCRKCDQFGARQDRYAAVIQDGEESIKR